MRTNLHERLFSLLLRAYPRPFREAHGDEMAELFRARLGRCTGAGDRLGLWVRLLADTCANALAVRRRASRNGFHHEGRGGMGTLFHDIRYAARHLARAPLFTLSAVVLLAVGIGANTAVFTVVDAVLLRPPPYDEPERVVGVYQHSDDGEPSSNAFPAYRDMTEVDVFEAVAASSLADVVLETEDQPLPVTIEFTTASYLDVLGLAPFRGRWFSPEHDQVGSAPVAVVSHITWETRFGSDPSVVGRTVRMNGQPVTVIGVGPQGLSGSYGALVTDFWLSISATPVGGSFRVANLDRREDHWYDVKARLAAGVSVAHAQSAMDALATRMGELYPELDRGRGITVFPASAVRLHPTADAAVFSAARLLMGIVGLVLVLACANLANLLLVRGIARSGEVAVRRAFGASAQRVGRLFIAESLLLALGGGVAGVALAMWLVSMLPNVPVPPPLTSTLDVRLDLRVLLFSGGLMLVTGVLFGLAPAIRSTRADVAGTLRDETRTSSAGRGTARLRNLLVSLQVAVSLVLVLGTGLLARSLVAVQSVETGVDPDRVAFVATSLGQAGLQDTEAGVALDELIARLAAIPGVTSAGATTRLPAQPAGTTTTVVEGYDPPAGTDAVELDFAVVSPGYFQTVGLALLEGRGFSPDDVQGTQTVVIVNETAARRFWGGADPVGRRMRAQGNPDGWRIVVGVVEDAPVSSLSEPQKPKFYFTSGQNTPSSVFLVARTDGDPSSLLPAMRDQMRAVRASLPVSRQGTLASAFGAGLSGQRFATAAMGVFALLAVLLASLGVYAVVAFSVARRSSELGIRMALGAERSGVVRMVVREVAGTVGGGLVAGIGLAALLVPQLGGVLFGVDPLDPTTFALGVGVLLLVSAAAAYMPARRAATVDPVEALRT